MKLKNYLRSQQERDGKIIIEKNIDYSILAEIKNAIINNVDIDVYIYDDVYKDSQFKKELFKCDTWYHLNNVLESLPLETVVCIEYDNNFIATYIEIY